MYFTEFLHQLTNDCVTQAFKSKDYNQPIDQTYDGVSESDKSKSLNRNNSISVKL